jgi:hypothetical protein
MKGNKMIIPYKEHRSEGIVTQALTQPYRIKVFERKGYSKIVLEKITGE